MYQNTIDFLSYPPTLPTRNKFRAKRVIDTQVLLSFQEVARLRLLKRKYIDIITPDES